MELQQGNSRLSILFEPMNISRKGVHKYYIWEKRNNPDKEFVYIEDYNEDTNQVLFSNVITGEKYGTDLVNFNRHYIEVNSVINVQ